MGPTHYGGGHSKPFRPKGGPVPTEHTRPKSHQALSSKAFKQGHVPEPCSWVVSESSGQARKRPHHLSYDACHGYVCSRSRAKRHGPAWWSTYIVWSSGESRPEAGWKSDTVDACLPDSISVVSGISWARNDRQGPSSFGHSMNAFCIRIQIFSL